MIYSVTSKKVQYFSQIFCGLFRKPELHISRYNRDTSVFTPSKNSVMSIWVTSLLSMAEVLKMVLEKYQVESDHDNYGLFLVKDMGERRQITEKEFPLLLR